MNSSKDNTFTDSFIYTGNAHEKGHFVALEGSVLS